MDSPDSNRRLPLIIAVGIILVLFATIWWGLGFRHYFSEVSHTREMSYAATMKQDLRNLVSAQEAYFAMNVTYTATMPDRFQGPDSLETFAPSEGVTITIGVATGTGWNATAKHNKGSKTCVIWVGSAPPPLEGAHEGEPKCT